MRSPAALLRAKLARLRPVTVPLLLLCELFSGVSFHFSILTLYYVEQLHGVQSASLLFTAEAILILLLEVPSGASADIFGRKWTAVIAFFTRFFAIFALSFGGWAGCLTYVLLAAISQSFASGTMDAMLYDTMLAHGNISDFEEVNSLYSSMWHFGSLGGALVCAVHMHDFTYKEICTVSVFPQAIACFLVVFLREPPYVKSDHRSVSKQMQQSWARVKSDPLLRKLLGCTVVQNGLGESSFYLKGILLKHIGSPQWLLFSERLGNDFAATAGKLSSDSVSRAVGKKTFFMWSSRVGACVSLSAIAYSSVFLPSEYHIYLAVPFGLEMVNGFIFGARTPLEKSLVNSCIPSSERATILSFFSMAWQLGVSVTLPVLGAVIQHVGVLPAFGACALVNLVVVPFMYSRVDFRVSEKED